MLTTLRKIGFLLLLTLVGISASAQINTSDSLALVDLYNNNGGSAWNDNTNWLTGPVSSWYGITVSSNRVREIDLSTNNLTGEFPALGVLVKLRLLNLHSNSLVGKADLSGLVSLEEVYGGRNDIEKVFMDQSMNELKILNFTKNEITESPSFQGLTALTSINLSENLIPELKPLFDLGSLEELIVSNNELTWIPSMTMQTNLRLLQCNDNKIEQLPALYMDTLTLRCERNKLDDLPDFTGLSVLTELSCEGNYLDFGDLNFFIFGGGPLPLSYSFDPQNDITVDKNYFLLNPSSTVTLEADVPGGVDYQWFRDGISLGFFGPSLVLGPGGAAPAIPGTYTCTVGSSILFPLTIEYGPLELDVFTSSDVIIDDDFANDTISGGVSVSYTGQRLVLTAEKWVVQDNSILQLNNVELFVANPDAQIIAEDLAFLDFSNTVIRPTMPDDTWEGTLLLNDAKTITNSSKIYNAFKGVAVFSGAQQDLQENSFVNCYRGLEFAVPRTASTFDQVSKNTFRLDECLPLHTVLSVPVDDYVGINVRNRVMGSFPVAPTISNNVFENATQIPCISYCGILAEDAGIYVQDNDYYDMYCGVDMNNPSQYSVIEGDSMVSLDLADCVATAYTVQNALAPVQITGLSLAKVPDQYDSIHLAVSALNCNRIWVNNCSLEFFDHGIVANDVDRLLSEQNFIRGGYVGTYMRNVKVLDMSCTDIEDILCGAAYAIDNDILTMVEANAPGYLANKINIVWNSFDLPDFNEMNGDPDHDGDYSLRLFGCPAGNPAVACPPAAGVVVNVAAPTVFENDMTTMDIEFTLDVPPFAFGVPDPTCGALRFADPEEGRSSRVSWMDALEEFSSDPPAISASTDFRVYPNPVSSWLYIEGEVAHAELFNGLGELVKSARFNGSGSLDLSDLPDGIYMLRLEGLLGRTETQRIVLTK